MGANMLLNQIPVNTPTANHAHTHTASSSSLTYKYTWIEKHTIPTKTKKLAYIIEQRDYKKCITQNR